MLEGETVLHFWFHRVCKAMGRVSELLPFTDPFEALLWIHIWKDPRSVAEGRVLYLSICQVYGHACIHTEHMLALSLWKGPMFYTELKCVAFMVPTPSSVLVLHFSRRTQSRTVRHDAWAHVGLDTLSHLFSPHSLWLTANSLVGLCAWSIT